MNSVVQNIDCMVGMKRFPDKWFDLAIVDPPYGLGKTWGKSSSLKWNKRDKYAHKKWNDSIPDGDYFKELFRVSNHQIIWGCNYYNSHIISAGRIVWDKKTVQQVTSACDLASQSFSNKIDLFRWMWDGYRQEEFEHRIHPTQKPVALYKWLLTHYAKQGDRILDTHLGSGSSRIAAYDLGFDFTGFELDKDYYEAQEKRFRQFKSQSKLFNHQQLRA